MTSAAAVEERARLRLVLITDGLGDPVRVERIVGAALAAGVRCVQLREPAWTARALFACCERLLPLCERHHATLLVNDRLDVVLAGVAHGAQIGHRSLPPEVARRVLGDDARLGFSAHDDRELDLARAGGCDFALLAPVWPTASKPGAAHLGVQRAAAATAFARVPVVWLGGVEAARLAALAGLPQHSRPAGVAVRSAIMAATDPAAACTTLLDALATALPAGPGAASGAGGS